MECPRCRANNRSGHRFCDECGASLTSACAICGFANGPEAKFCGGCGNATTAATLAERSGSSHSYTPGHLAEKILNSKSTLEGERKQVTVLFADMKGSLELLADRDPEDARKLLDPVLESLMEAVHRYEGTVNQVMGDGIMALFGAPLAHEDHAVRACYAALRMQASVEQYAGEVFRSHGVPLRIRVGLNSGEVVVRTIGSDLRMDYTAVGQTTHVAARMEQLADPGTTLLTHATLQLVEGYVEVKARGPVPIKGLAEPIEVYDLVGVGAIRSRFQSAVARGLTRFVGRDAEMDQLRLALERTEAGHGQVVAMVGEPGVGKSRLYREITHSHRTRGWLILESGSVSYGKATAYLPIIDLLKAYFNVQDWDDHRTIREKVIGKVLSLDRAQAPSVPPLLSLLDVPVGDPQWERLDPPERRQQTINGVKRLLLRETQQQPLLLLLEDLHWIDTETQALLDSLIESVPTSRLLLLFSYRPEFQHGWGNKTYYSQLQINPLPWESAEKLLETLLGEEPGLRALKQMLIERTEGNPLFLEESVRSLVETEVLVGERGKHRLARPAHTIQIPATVQAILAARIDRLAPEDKHLLQAASVIGLELPFALLKAVSDLPEDRVHHSLAHLQVAEFLYEAHLFPDLEYRFKHALTHEVAYNSLLSDQRRSLHVRILGAMESLYSDRLSEQVERFAHHAFRGEAWEQAFRYYSAAGSRALARSAHVEALNHVDHALESLEKLEDAPERKTLELELVTQRGAALRALHGYAATEVENVYLKARELCRDLPDNPDRFRVEWQQMQFFLVRGDLHTASELATSLLEHAQQGQDRALLIDAYLANGMTLFHLGRFAEARDHLERGVALYHPELDQPHLFTHGQEPGVFCLSYLAWAVWFLGFPDQAKVLVERALRIARQRAHALSYASALTFAARVYQGRRDLEKVRLVAGDLVSLSRERGFSYYEAQGLIHQGWTLVLIGEDQAGCSQLVEGYMALERTGTVLGLRGALVQLAEAWQKLGFVDKASWAVDRAHNQEHGRGTHCWEAEIARLRAELIGEGRDQDRHAARSAYRMALEVARRQGARSLELRSALSYAKASLSQGQSGEARELLEQIVSAFTEGTDTVELREAQRVLNL